MAPAATPGDRASPARRSSTIRPPIGTSATATIASRDQGDHGVRERDAIGEPRTKRRRSGRPEAPEHDGHQDRHHARRARHRHEDEPAADASLGREADERDDVGRHQEQDRDDATGPEVRILPGAFGGISISSHDGVGGVRRGRRGGCAPVTIAIAAIAATAAIHGSPAGPARSANGIAPTSPTPRRPARKPPRPGSSVVAVATGKRVSSATALRTVDITPPRQAAGRAPDRPRRPRGSDSARSVSAGVPSADDPAGRQDDDPREEVGREGEVVEDRDDRRAVPLVEVDEQLHHLDLVADIEVGRSARRGPGSAQPARRRRR